MMMRLGYVSVPACQIALSIGILVLTTVFFVFASARIFRWALLLYGKKFTLRELLAVLRGRPDAVVLLQGAPSKKQTA
jgi:ABC-type Na+ efflux pump permease subunit